MKKLFTCIVLSILVIQTILLQPVAAEKDSITVVINDQAQHFDQDPIIINNTTMVPLRGIFESLGATVFWNAKARIIVAQKDLKVISITVDRDVAMVNGKQVTMSQTAQVINGRTMVPLRFVSEALGAQVAWDGTTKTVIISDDSVNQSAEDVSIGNEQDEPIKIIFGEEEPLEFYVEPVMENGIVLASITPIVDSMWKLGAGHSTGHSYGGGITTISGNIGDFFSFSFESNNTTADINQKEKILPIAPKVISDRLLIPVEFFVKEYGLIYSWDEAARTATISYPSFGLLIDEIKNTDIEQLRYEGEFTEGEWTGTGSFYYTNGQPFYTGEIKNRMLEGKGTFYLLNGLKSHEGHFEDGVLQGDGKTYYHYGDQHYLQYDGQFKDGLRNGLGTLYSGPDDLWYVGGWKDGEFHGKGKVYIEGTVVYDGDWIEHNKDGFGKEYYQINASLKYEGDFSNDLYHGQGAFYFMNGSKFVGQFVEGEFGEGTFYEKINEKYEAVEQVENGTGKKFFVNGDYYTGELISGIPNGTGKYYQADGYLLYEGEFLDGKYHGQGSHFTDYATYTGEFLEGQLVQGKMLTNDVLEYEGQFLDFYFHGEGKLYEYGQLSYEGDFVEGSKHGDGKEFYIPGGLMFEGSYNMGSKEGYGTLYYHNENKWYEGDFSHGRFHGNGKFYNEQGKLTYDGEFESNLMHGTGTLYFGNGDRFEGEFEYDSLKTGSYYNENNERVYLDQEGQSQGRLYYDSGDVYTGDLMNGLPHGEGTYYEASGKKYIGEHTRGKIQGVGSYYRSDGTLFYKGEIENALPDGQGTLYDTNGNLLAEGEFYKGLLVKDNSPTSQLNETRTIESISNNLQKVVLDGMENTYDNIDSTEAVMILQLATEQDFIQFMGLTHQGKIELINSYVQDHWGDIIGVDHCYISVKFEGDTYIQTLISYQDTNDNVVLYYQAN
jgi:hypothetical protein